jgi:hypothetical protein
VESLGVSSLSSFSGLRFIWNLEQEIRIRKYLSTIWWSRIIWYFRSHFLDWMDCLFFIVCCDIHRAPREALSITTARIRRCHQRFLGRRTENIIFTKLHTCKSIKIKDAQNYEATAGTRAAGQLKCTNVRDLTVTLPRTASQSSRAPTRLYGLSWNLNSSSGLIHHHMRRTTTLRVVQSSRSYPNSLQHFGFLIC